MAPPYFVFGKSAALALAVALTAAGSPAHARTIYSLDAGGYSAEPQAQEAAAKLASTMSPVFVEKDADSATGSPFRVRVGHFAYSAEAHAFESKLTPSVLPTCSVVRWDWDGRTLESNRLPVALPFEQAAIQSLPRAAECLLDYEKSVESEIPPAAKEAVAATDIDTLSDQQLLDRGKYISGSDAKTTALELLLLKYPKSQLANPARLELTRLHIRAKRFDVASQMIDAVRIGGQPSERSTAKWLAAYLVYASRPKPEALAAFSAVANASQADSGHRLDSMLRVATLAQFARDYPTAWLAYSQVERTVSTPKIQALVKMRKASVAFELVADGQSNWEDVRTLCQLAEAVADAPPDDRATARLMWAETFFKEGDYARSLQEMDKLIADYSGQNRERVTARYWKARCLYFLGQYDAAVAQYDAVLADPAKCSEMFSALNAKARGLLEKARINQRSSRIDEMRQNLADLQAAFPDSTEAAAARTAGLK